MIAVDTNILVYAHREDSSFHKMADQCITEIAESGNDWAIPWPCIHEFLAIVTHPKIFNPPSPLNVALEQIECWFESPTLHMIGEGIEYWRYLKKVLRTGQITGPLIHDARIAVICLQQGVNILWSADRDFSRIPTLKLYNPLIKKS